MTQDKDIKTVYYTFHRLIFYRDQIEQLSNDNDEIIITIDPTPASSERGYVRGQVIMSLKDFYDFFGHITNTRSWDNPRNYHYPQPPKKMMPFFKPY